MSDDKPKRASKTVERLTCGEVKEKGAFQVLPGNGTKLRDIPNVEFRIGKAASSSEEVKALHKLCYGTPGVKTVVKKHLRDFSGLPDGSRDKKLESANRLDSAVIKKVMMMCDVPTTGTKVEQAARLIAFLEAPSASEKKLDAEKVGAKRKRTEKIAKKGQGRGSKGSATKIKRPLSAYLLYCNNKREKVKAENPDASFTDLTKILAEKWKLISDERRANYHRQAAELKAEYDKKVAKAGASVKSSPKAKKSVKKAKAEAAEETVEDAADDEDDEEDEDEEGDEEDGAEDEGADKAGDDDDDAGEDDAEEDDQDGAGKDDDDEEVKDEAAEKDGDQSD